MRNGAYSEVCCLDRPVTFGSVVTDASCSGSVTVESSRSAEMHSTVTDEDGWISIEVEAIEAGAKLRRAAGAGPDAGEVPAGELGPGDAGGASGCRNGGSSDERRRKR